MSEKANNIAEAARLLQTAVSLLQQQERPETEANTSNPTNTAADVLAEHRQLFGRPGSNRGRILNFNRSRPYNNQRSANGSVLSSQRENVGHRMSRRRTVKKVVVALSGKNTHRVPSQHEKYILHANGLGERAVIFTAHGSATEMKSAIMSTFPKFEEGGGFEVLRTAENSRSDLVVASVGPCCVDDFVQIATGRIYVRPIQNNIAIDHSKSTMVSEDLEECHTCGILIDIMQLRQHVNECKKTIQSHGRDSEEDDFLPDLFGADGTRPVMGAVQSVQVVDSNTSSNTVSSPETSSTNPAVSNPETSSTNPAVSNPETSSTNPAVSNPETSSTNRVGISVTAEQKVNSVEEIIAKLRDIHDPVSVLKEYQKHFLLGRKLELTSETDVLEGDATSIFVSRDRILETGFSELMEPEVDYRLPLDVTFYGEEAQDAGGPRKEFFTLMLREIVKEENNLFQKDEEEQQFVFTEDENNIEKKWFYAAGLLCGLTIIQNGPLPTFVRDFDLVVEKPTRSQEQFLEGLNKVGLVDVIKAKPCVRFLFQATAKNDITLRKLKHLLTPKMDEAGSNKRRRQEKVYEMFLQYLKEVAAGRREVHSGKMSLGHVLRFITGSDWEPVLGFCISPKIVFTETLKEDHGGGLLPRSSTCINCLFLPVPGVLDPMQDSSRLFELYDLAFCNSYFGLN